MNSSAAPAIRPAPYLAARFDAFRVSGDQTARLSIGEPASLSGAVETAQHTCLHREQLLIRETGEDGAVKLHVFTIRKKAPRWVHQPGEIMPRRVEDHYADPICVIPGELLG